MTIIGRTDGLTGTTGVPVSAPLDAAEPCGDARVRVFDICVDPVTPAEAVARIASWCRTGARHLVVTPNMDHAVALRTNAALRDVYERAGLILTDGMPLVWASRLGGTRVPERVTGSDLIEPLCRAMAADGRKAFLLGTSLPTLAAAARRLSRSCGVDIAGVYSPPYGEAFDEAENDAIVAMINSVAPDVVFVALGMPKQELWAGRNVDRLDTHAVLCIGAGLDYLAGTVKRAPVALQRVGLEWLWRAATEPSRLARRYARNLAYLPLLLADQILQRAPR